MAMHLLVAFLCCVGLGSGVIHRAHHEPHESLDNAPRAAAPRSGAAAAAAFEFPRQFHANFSIAAHLVDKSKSYPPWRRRVEVWYDADERKVKAFVHEGFETNKTFLRRYDTKNEYAIRSDEFEECRRSFLSEPLGDVAFPPDLTRLTGRAGSATVGGRAVSVWSRRDDYQRVKVFVDDTTGVPISVTDEYNVEGAYVPVMTWTIENITIGRPDASAFDLPHPWTHKRCIRHIGGWPYIHLFHHYLKV